ncbi:MAG: tRNA (adenosine(37)-N6)-threonylcarbamoyltransferase complex ATPase subunit type 1 TsaE [Pseudomonadota bacterium]
MSRTLELSTTSARHTERIAAAMATVCGPGDLIALVGPLGAGKTRFVSGFVAALPGSDHVRVSSPTFTTVNTYPTTPPVFHMDLYRLAPGVDVDQLGYEEYTEGDGICLVEWFDRAPRVAPADFLEIRFALRAGSRRRLTLCAHGPRSRRLLPQR